MLTRAAMIYKCRLHGWEVQTDFDGTGPLLVVRVDSGKGCITVRVPVYLHADHSDAMEELYYGYMYGQEQQGKTGRA